MTTAVIGQPVNRVDGRRKVTGSATYAAEFDRPSRAYGSIVRSTIANGRIASIDSAAADIQSAIARVQRRLPDEMTEPPSYRKVNPADAPIMILALSGDVTPLPEMDAFGQQVISPALSTIEGVAQVQVFGQVNFAHSARSELGKNPVMRNCFGNHGAFPTSR